MRKNAGHPCSTLSNCLSQLSVSANQLCTTRTRHVPPAFASTVHSVAIAGEPGPMPPSFMAVKRRGGSHSWISDCASMPGPKLATIDPFARPSIWAAPESGAAPVIPAVRQRVAD